MRAGLISLPTLAGHLESLHLESQRRRRSWWPSGRARLSPGSVRARRARFDGVSCATCPGGAGSGRPAPQPRTRDWSYGRRLLPMYCPLRPGEEGTKFNGGAGPACRTRVRRPPPSALVEGRRAPSSTCSACNKLVGQLPQSWPFALGRAGFSHHEGAVYRSTDLPHLGALRCGCFRPQTHPPR